MTVKMTNEADYSNDELKALRNAALAEHAEINETFLELVAHGSTPSPSIKAKRDVAQAEVTRLSAIINRCNKEILRRF
jgi:hypothetical protein